MTPKRKQEQIRCDECKQIITQRVFGLDNGKATHIDFDQCFRALNKRIRELEADLKKAK